MRSKILGSLTVLALAAGLADAQRRTPAPPPVPVISLPPIELVPSSIDHPFLLAAGDVEDWGIQDLNTKAAWATTRGEGVVVAVLDTGVYARHKDLKDQIVGEIDVTGEGVADVSGHGTWCAGCVCAEENDWGVIGHAPKAKVLVVKVLRGRQGSGRVDGIALGIRRAVDWRGPNGERVGVISMSLGGRSTDSYIPPAIRYAKAQGVVVVAAAGNDGPGQGTVGYPGGYPDVVCVAAHDAKGNTAQFSSRGPAVFVSGPGVNTRSCYPGGPAAPDGQFATISGTSMATPAVAALAALWVSANGGAWDATRGDRFRDALQASCTRPNGPRTAAGGYGKPDAAKLVAGGTKPPPPPATFQFDLADFSDAGRAKVLKARPGFKTGEFVLKP